MVDRTNDDDHGPEPDIVFVAGKASELPVQGDGDRVIGFAKTPQSDGTGDGDGASDFPAQLFEDGPAKEWEQPAHFYDVIGAPVPDCPLHLFPDPIRKLAEAAENSAYCDPGVTAMLATAAIGGCAQRTRILEVEPGWEENVGIYMIGSQPTGESKSPAVKAVRAPIDQWVKDRKRPDGLAREEHALKIEKLQEQLSLKSETKLTDEALAIKRYDLKDTIANAPRPTRIFAENCTPEALARIAAEQDGSISIISAEGSVLLTLTGARYGKNGVDLAILLKAYSGEVHIVDRQSDSKDEERPEDKPLAFTLAMTIQPSALYQVASLPGINSEGFLPRTMVICPQSRLGSRDWMSTTPIPEEVKAAWACACHDLLDLTATDHRDLITCTLEARHAIKLIKQDCENRCAEGGDLREVAGWAQKLAGNIARLAVDFMLADSAKSKILTLEYVEKADGLRPWIIANQKKMYRLTGGGGAPPAGAWAIGQWLCKKGATSFSASELYQGIRKQRWVNDSIDNLWTPLQLLIECGWIRRLPDPPRKPGKPPSPRFEVHQLIYSGAFDPDLRGDAK